MHSKGYLVLVTFHVERHFLEVILFCICFFELDSSLQFLFLQHFYEKHPANSYLFSLIICCQSSQLQSQEHLGNHENYA